MMTIKEKIKIKINLELQKIGVENVDFLLEHSADLNNGDYSTNVAMVTMRLVAQTLGGHVNEKWVTWNRFKSSNPIDLANYLVDNLKNEIEEIEKVEVAGPGFINFFLKKEFFSEQVKEINESGEEYGKNDLLRGEKIFFEHTQPNPFKEFHIGHMMNNTIGESVSRVLKESGVELKVCSYHGDVGLHVAKAIWGILEQPDSVADSYARGHKAYEDDEDAKKEIIEINKKIYDRSDDKINSLYENGKK
jgi:arginyl-tRNA synthetase